MEIITKNAKETFELGEKIGSDLSGGVVLAFTGDLGAGKTTFIQGLAHGLGIKSKIISPTFILMRTYKGNKFNFYHLDLYRLEGNIENQVKDLGLEDIWIEKDNVIAIEWAEKAKELLPQNTKYIKIENVGESERKFIIE